MNRFSIIGCLLGCLGSLLPVRSANLVQFPSGNTAWQVDITATPGPLTATKVEVTRMNDISRVIITSPKSSIERWKLDSLGLFLMSFPNSSNHSIYVMSESSPQAKDISIVSDASAFQWLRSDMLTSKDPVTYNGKECLHFQTNISIAEVDPVFAPEPAIGQSTAVPLVVKCEAWVETKTLLPVALQHPFARYVFTFLPPPKAPLQMPIDFQAELNRWKIATTPPRRLY
jgi:hypothetical protein